MTYSPILSLLLGVLRLNSPEVVRLASYELRKWYVPSYTLLQQRLYMPSQRVSTRSNHWRAGASQLNRTTGMIFLVYIYIYIYIYHGQCHTANRLRVSKLTQLTIFHRSSPRVYRHGDSSRRCTLATVQDEANPSSSQPAASCCVASESTEAHRDGWREYVLAEESVLPRKQPKRKRGV